MSTYICFKCNHQWFKRGDIPPKRCPNHSCRTLKWGRPLDVEKKSAVPSELIEKKQVFEELKALIGSAPTRRPVAGYQLPPKEDQPDIYSEPTVNYD